MKVVFYNLWHRGDLHVSRTFVKRIADVLKTNNIECGYYYNSSDTTILEDTGVKWHPYSPHMDNGGFKVIDGTILIDTWYRSNPAIFSKCGVTFDCLYYLFSEYCNYLKVPISNLGDPIDFFPVIDYNKYYIDNAKEFIDKIFGKKKIVFVSNGEVTSCQSSSGIDYDGIIYDISRYYPNVVFLLTSNNKNVRADNIFYTGEIINKPNNMCDLNENSYLSAFSDVIIGKSSGPYTYSMTRINMYALGKTYVCFYNKSNPAYQNLGQWRWTNGVLPEYTCTVISETPTYNAIKNTIIKAIQKHI